MKIRIFSLLSIALLLAAQPVLRVTTRLVEVSVVVRDKNGPVRGLTQDDFTLLEKGKKRKIAVFSASAAAATLSAVAAKSSASPALSPAPLPALVTNRPAAGETPANVTVVLLDALNTDSKDQNYARQQLLRFLRQIRPEDRVAVYTLGSQLRVLNDFSSDARRLAATVARYSGEVGFTSAADSPLADNPVGIGSDKIIMDAIQNQARDMVSDYSIQMRAEKTAAALEAIAQHIGSIPGRKNLIWITSGFPFVIGLIGDGQTNSEDNAFDDNISGVTAAKKGAGMSQSTALYGANDRDGNPARNQKSFTPEALRATRALNDANIAVYPIDARGLTVMPKSMSVEQNYGLSRSQAVAPAKGMSTILTGTTAMQNVAEATGGLVFNNGNDLQKAIRTAVDDGEATYTLGFYVDASELDSTFHSLKVQLRRKDVEIRFRKGFLALPENAKQQADSLRDALLSPLQASGIGLTAGTEPGDKAGSLRIGVAIEPRDLALEQKDGKWSAALDLVFSQRSPEGRELAVSTTPLGLSLDRARYDTVLSEGLSITKTVELNSAAAEIRVLVRDRATGRMGSLVLPLK
jgi:VWFA-related protein